VSSTSFHERSVSFATPNFSLFSRSILLSCPCGARRWKKTVGRPVMMWKCFPSGRKFKNAITMVMCRSTPAVVAACAACAERPERKRPAKALDTGKYQGASPLFCESAAASMKTSVQRTPRIMQRMNVPSHESVRRSFFSTRRK